MDYIHLEWFDVPNWELVRGHVDPVGAVELICTEGFWDDQEFTWFVSHEYARWTPCAHYHSDFDSMIHLVDGPARGAFPVTVARMI